MIKRLLAGILLLAGALYLSQCKKSNDKKGFTLSGVVIDESGQSVSSASIKINGQSADAGSDGSFSFSNLPKQDVYKLEVSSPAFYTAYKNVENIDGSSLYAKIVVLSKTNLGTISAASGGSVGATGLRVVAPANGFTTANGTNFTGQVVVSAKYITQTNPNIAAMMPGGDFRATDQNGNDGGMRTYGFVATEFTDQAGNKLTPNANVKVGVTIPAGLASPDNAAVNNWGYDPEQGKWNKPTSITKTGSEYFFPCVTLYQNIDAFIQTGTLTGTVNCTDGNPAPFVTVSIQSRYDKYEVVTNEAGKFRAKIEATNGSWTYTVTPAGGNAVTVNSVPANSTTTVSGLATSQCNNAAPPTGGTGSGKFSYSGGSFSGLCASVPDVVGCANGIDVAIVTTNGTSIALYNVPQASSGSYPLTDGYLFTNNCSFFALLTFANGTQLASKSGTLTKTGARSFTFTIVMYDLNTNNSYNVTGNGNY